MAGNWLIKSKKKYHALILSSTQFSGFVLSFQSVPLVLEKEKADIRLELLPASFKQFPLLVNLKRKQKKSSSLYSNSQCLTLEIKALLLNLLSGLSSVIRSSPFFYQNQLLLEFEVDSMKNSLKSDEKQANSLLAYLFFTHKRYEQALHFLEISETSLALSPSHRSLYDWIDQWPDTTPEGLAFKLHSRIALGSSI